MSGHSRLSPFNSVHYPFHSPSYTGSLFDTLLDLVTVCWVSTVLHNGVTIYRNIDTINRNYQYNVKFSLAIHSFPVHVKQNVLFFRKKTWS